VLAQTYTFSFSRSKVLALVS